MARKFKRSSKRIAWVVARLKEVANEEGKVPYGTYGILAKEFDLTRARIHQIAKKAGITSEQSIRK